MSCSANLFRFMPVIVLLAPLAMVSEEASAVHVAEDLSPTEASSIEDRSMPSERRFYITYGFTIELPVDQVEKTQKQHLEECKRLGCVVQNTGLNISDSIVTANTSVRLLPKALDQFAKIITAEPLKVSSRSQNSVDQTLPFAATNKDLEIKTALRDKLRGMLVASPQKDAIDLVAIESELAKVLSSIEVVTAQQTQLRTVTENVTVNIHYMTSVPDAVDNTSAPVREAFAMIRAP